VWPSSWQPRMARIVARTRAAQKEGGTDLLSGPER